MYCQVTKTLGGGMCASAERDERNVEKARVEK